MKNGYIWLLQALCWNRVRRVASYGNDSKGDDGTMEVSWTYCIRVDTNTERHFKLTWKKVWHLNILLAVHYVNNVYSMFMQQQCTIAFWVCVIWPHLALLWSQSLGLDFLPKATHALDWLYNWGRADNVMFITSALAPKGGIRTTKLVEKMWSSEVTFPSSRWWVDLKNKTKQNERYFAIPHRVTPY